MKSTVSRCCREVDGLDLCFVTGLGVLGAGTWMAFDLGAALMVLGGVLTGLGLVAVLRKAI